jgi:hypothetical protein
MSSVTRSSTSTPQHSETHTAKKKFGKNLNKLTKAPAPPINSGAPKSNGSSRNGLLSTKRNTSAASGILAQKVASSPSHKPLPSLGLQYESNTSTHDALLGAVVGASRAEAQHQPDAWGVAQQEKVSSPVEDSNRREEQRADAPSSSGEEAPRWDDYGGRQSQVGAAHDTQETAEQGARMSKLAKERTEKRRSEEEARFASQKERASQRLKELEEKMHMDSVEPKPPQPPNAVEPPTVADRIPRTLYDPDRAYSSLVGDPDTNNENNRGSPEVTPPQRNGRGQYVPSSPEVPSQGDPQFSRQQVVHLSSYEDRDRGERGTSAGPRMLYDPKSGSMVAVPTRDDSAAGRGRKERAKKGRNNGREKDSRQETTTTEKSGRKAKGQGRKEENGVRGRGADLASPSKGEAKKGRVVNSEGKVPRTCGVLYARDEKGNLHCADGCDGDLGYGAHSVPGGRARYPEGYAKYLENQKEGPQDESPLYDDQYGAEDSYYEADGHENGESVTLQTGFSLPEPKEPKFEWIKPNEKIALMTGIDDSPTLQATAKEWAPSQAALAAAAAAIEIEKANAPTSVGSNDGQEDDHESDDDGPVSFTPRACGNLIFGILAHFAFACIVVRTWLRPDFEHGFYDAVSVA